MQWQIKSKLPDNLDSSVRLQAIMDAIFGSRDLPNSDLTLKLILEMLPDLDQKQLQKAVVILKKAIKTKQPIIIYGDYDCDGVCATAILWRALHDQGAICLPFLPHRQQHGYGLSSKGLTDALKLFPDQKSLIVTVDNGIRAREAAEFLKKEGIDLVITDHHIVPEVLPSAKAIVHTTALCGAGIAWILASQFAANPSVELVALATVCDQLPLLGPNRLFVKVGLEQLRHTAHPGLLALFQTAQINNPDLLDTYHLGFVIGPRINAAGRLGHALDALRLLCTNSPTKAAEYAQQLNDQNVTRQELTTDYYQEALAFFQSQKPLPKLLFYLKEGIPEGLLGLIAAKLTEQFCRPSLVLSTGDQTIKGSARSLAGIDITHLLTQASEYLLDFGGHTQAAGFTTTIDQLSLLEKRLQELSDPLDESLFVKKLDIELELLPTDINQSLSNALDQFSPFGLANPQPIFMSTFNQYQYKIIGQTKKHLKINLFNDNQPFSAIGFNFASRAKELSSNQPLQFAFTLEKNTYLGKTNLQLNLKDWRCV